VVFALKIEIVLHREVESFVFDVFAGIAAFRNWKVRLLCAVAEQLPAKKRNIAEATHSLAVMEVVCHAA
jgi:hypothetical protein